MTKSQPIKRHCLSVLVTNEPGVLARVVGLFSGRGYNIESLAVAEVDGERRFSRITLVTSGTDDIVSQIKVQLGRLVPVQRIINLTESGAWIEREAALIKVLVEDSKRAEVVRLSATFGAKPVQADATPLVFEVMGACAQIDDFIKAMQSHGLIEVARTGIVGIGADVKTL